MEIKENKFKRFFKRYGALSLACILSLGILLGIGVSLPLEEEGQEKQPVNTGVIEFALPMQNAVVVKDYADDRLQLNESLNRWEIHLAIDLASENDNVFAVCDGIVTSVDSNSLEGYIIQIEHDDGFVSVYSSLSDSVNVKEGDKVLSGQLIGYASTTATNESVDGSHLHFVLLKDGVEVDPNNYLDLQNK